MLHTEQPGILYSAKPWWLEQICKEIAKLSTLRSLLPIVINYFYEM